jgi:hypothetical protein
VGWGGKLAPNQGSSRVTQLETTEKCELLFVWSGVRIDLI